MPKPPPSKDVSEYAFAIMVMIYYAAITKPGVNSVPPGLEAVETATEQTQLIVDYLATYAPSI